MENIRPISDLRNNFAQISKLVNDNNETIFLTKNGYGNMVVMSIKEYRRLTFENEIKVKLLEASKVAKKSKERYSHEEVFKQLRCMMDEKI